jgi:hypothetical protein
MQVKNTQRARVYAVDDGDQLLVIVDFVVRILECIFSQNQMQITLTQIKNHHTTQEKKKNQIRKRKKILSYSILEGFHEPTYIRNWHPLMVKTHEDPFEDIPIKHLFSLVYVHMQSHQSINLGDKDEYVLTMKHQMNCFKYYSISMILQNIDNININIKMFNEQYNLFIKSSQRPLLMRNITQEELSKIVVWGTHIIKQFTKDTLNNKEAIVSKKDKTDEYCFTMKTLPWDIEQTSKNLSHVWIGDTGASCHFTNANTAFIDWTPIHHVIGVGNRNVITASKIGTVRLEVQQRSGKRNFVILQGCKFAKELNNNFFSITQALAKG